MREIAVAVAMLVASCQAFSTNREGVHTVERFDGSVLGPYFKDELKAHSEELNDLPEALALTGEDDLTIDGLGIPITDGLEDMEVDDDYEGSGDMMNNDGNTNNEAEIVDDGIVMLTDGAEIPIKVVETPIEGAEIPIKVVETPIEGDEEPIEGDETAINVAEAPIDESESPVGLIDGNETRPDEVVKTGPNTTIGVKALNERVEGEAPTQLATGNEEIATDLFFDDKEDYNRTTVPHSELGTTLNSTQSTIKSTTTKQTTTSTKNPDQVPTSGPSPCNKVCANALHSSFRMTVNPNLTYLEQGKSLTLQCEVLAPGILNTTDQMVTDVDIRWMFEASDPPQG